LDHHEHCQIEYIPHHLKRNGRDPINEFFISERLYKRWKNPNTNHPYTDISLTDLSHNRQGTSENILSEPSDVLFNIDSKDGCERYDEAYIAIEIMELTDDQKYYKEIVDDKNSAIWAEITLEHTPLVCNYSHCEFVFYFKGEKVKWVNYGATLGSTEAKTVRKTCRNELSKMFVRKEIWLN